jgi:phosphoribosylanthranilate isomerase
MVKICGVTTVDDARLAVDLGADLLGLNFHPPSPRALDEPRARALADAVRGETLLVGVFVEGDPGGLPGALETADRLGLDLVQWVPIQPSPSGLPGGDVLSVLGSRGLPTIRASILPEASTLRAARAEHGTWGFLFDVPAQPGDALPGGTGRSWDYSALAPLAGVDFPLLVAGGIDPDNVRQALVDSHAAGVDVCSGIEEKPGTKDRRLTCKLFEEISHGTSPETT